MERIAALLIIVGILLGLQGVCRGVNDLKWNDGHCSCGGNWNYVQAVGHYSSTTYLYECDKCGKAKEFYKKR